MTPWPSDVPKRTMPMQVARDMPQPPTEIPFYRTAGNIPSQSVSTF
ncbi:hypothetical protein FOMA001_g6085 [Fusarium oxysporum f. sp. matthiolae]|nr:hypothetical protein FOMA001_g6085 [Fusarium oxysporum f. sp. matthiolae]